MTRVNNLHAGKKISADDILKYIVFFNMFKPERCGLEIERYRVRSPLTASVVSLSKRLYPHCLVLVSTQEKRGPHGRLVLDY